MKRNEKKVPGFDEIIFRNRNRAYGAYDLRKRYKTAASISVLGVSALFTALILVLSGMMPKEATATGGRVIYMPTKLDPYIDPNKFVKIEDVKPVKQPETNAYVPPVVTDDTTMKNDGLMATDLMISTTRDPGVVEKIDSVMKEIAPEPAIDDEPVIISQEPPFFPGGEEALLKYIADNTKYPQEAIDINLQGKVLVKFAVMKDGSVSKIQVLRGISPLLDNEAMRVVSTLPKWKPGKQNGNPVSVWFMVPVTFRITGMN